MKRPEENLYKINAVDGDELCRYIANKLYLDGYEYDEEDVYYTIGYHHITEGIELVGLIIELIIEEEAYCNGDEKEDIILKAIAEEFGGHFNINFLSMTAYL